MGTLSRNRRPARALFALAALLGGARIASAADDPGPPLVLADGTVIDAGTLPPSAEFFARGSAALQGRVAGQQRHGHVFRSAGAADKVCSLGAVDRSQTPSLRQALSEK
jgi:hypothetical protein